MITRSYGSAYIFPNQKSLLTSMPLSHLRVNFVKFYQKFSLILTRKLSFLMEFLWYIIGGNPVPSLKIDLQSTEQHLVAYSLKLPVSAVLGQHLFHENLPLRQGEQ